MTTPAQLLQIASECLAVGTPWLVVRIVTALAPPMDHAAATRYRAAMLRLIVGTLAAAAAVSALGLVSEPESLRMALAGLLGFAVMSALAWPALSAVDDGTKSSRDLDVPVRVASLRPRHIRDFVSPMRRAVPFSLAAVGVLAFALRLVNVGNAGGDGQRLLVPIVFVLGAIVFLFLYERWIYEEVTGGHVADGLAADADRRRRVLLIHAWQTALVAGLIAVGHAILQVDWVAQPTIGVAFALAGGVLGIVGCARALASQLGARRYVTPTRHT